MKESQKIIEAKEPIYLEWPEAGVMNLGLRGKFLCNLSEAFENCILLARALLCLDLRDLKKITPTIRLQEISGRKLPPWASLQ